jgi:ankyrin repeat protein
MPVFDAPLEAYARAADALWDALRAGDENAAWAFKWKLPRYDSKPVTEVDPASLGHADARTVMARQHAFDSWDDLATFTETVREGSEVRRFEEAVEAVVSGDLRTLRDALLAHPGLVRARSARQHHATLLHYVAANGVEDDRQRTPPNAEEVAALLLESGADPNALADVYGARCTALSMLVSSTPPARAGLQSRLAETLLDHGAALEGALATALAFGFAATARTLADRGAPVADLATAAGLGLTEHVRRFLPASDASTRQIALALAAQHGHAEVVRLLLDAGVDPSHHNPVGFHPHSTPLHQAVWANHAEVVRLLAERGARLDVKDTLHQGTPLDWAVYGKRTEIAEYLRGRESGGRR